MLRRFKAVLLCGIAAGAVVALAFAVGDIAAHAYLDRALWRLGLELARDRLLTGLVLGLAAAVAFHLLDGLVPLLLPQVRRSSGSTRRAWRALGGLAVFAGGLLVYDTELWKSLLGATAPGIALDQLEGSAQLAALALFALLVAGLACGSFFLLRSPRVASRLERLAGTCRRLITPVAIVALVLIAIVASWFEALETLRRPQGPNLVLVTVDTLRRDHLGIHGHREITPNIDRLARGGITFTHAVSQAPWTLPAMATIFTALYPSQHGALYPRRIISRRITTVVEVLRNAGYRTVGVTSHLLLGSRYGFAQGFADFDQSPDLWKAQVSSHLVSERALDRLGTADDEPYFLWAHYFDPHDVYIGHPEYGLASRRGDYPERYTTDELEKRHQRIERAEIQHVVDLYDEEIAFTDAAIGRLVDQLRALSSKRPTVILLTADHGEHWMERKRFGHGKDLYRQVVDVPLIVAGDVDEELRGLVVTTPVETRQIAQTLLELARLEHEAIDGTSLLRVAKERARGPAVSFAESRHAGGSVAAWIDGWKLIRNLGDGSEELYRVDRDPNERRSLTGSSAPQALEALTTLRRSLDEFRSMDRASAPALELSAEETEHLRALGYLQ